MEWFSIIASCLQIFCWNDILFRRNSDKKGNEGILIRAKEEA